MASATPTIAELYLAFRQAKAALFFEKRGVGLIELAAYEQNLPENLKALQAKLAKGRWFDRLQIGWNALHLRARDRKKVCTK